MSWKRVRGHEGQIKSFADIVARGRLGHAYLFVGPAGVGKRFFATELAKALMCENTARKFDACDCCPACMQIEAGTHPDVIFSARPEEKLEFPIAVIRDLIEKLSLKPARGGHKLAIIDDADEFNDESANAFLKTLEEPPPRSLLILLATDLERQLTTIVSRCQIVRFSPLPTPLVSEVLREHGIEADKAERLARLSGGSPGQASELADDAIWEFRRELVIELSQAKLDTVKMGERWMAFVEDAGKEASLQRRRAAQVIRLAVELLSRALAVSSGGDLERVDVGDRPAVSALAQRLGTEPLLRLIDRCLEANHQIDRRVQLVLLIEAVADAFNVSGPRV